MTRIFKTKLLGKERAEPTVPYQNVGGTLYAEGGSLIFRTSSNETLWSTPFENIEDYGWEWDRWRNDLGHSITNFVGEAMTLGIFNPNRYLYVWVQYHDERVGKLCAVRFLVSDALLDEGKGNKLVLTIGEAIASYRDTLRRATRPR